MAMWSKLVDMIRQLSRRHGHWCYGLHLGTRILRSDPRTLYAWHAARRTRSACKIRNFSWYAIHGASAPFDFCGLTLVNRYGSKKACWIRTSGDRTSLSTITWLRI
eukprot:6206762-Pleurochrysis_carterae.AAC.1